MPSFDEIVKAAIGERESRIIEQLSKEDPDAAILVMEGIAGKHYNHGKYRSSPYYNERVAKLLIPMLDTMIAKSPNQIQLYYRDFPGYQQNTLYQRIHHAWAYVIDFLDTDDKRYAKVRGQYKTKKTPTGIVIYKSEDAYIDFKFHIVDDMPIEDFAQGVQEHKVHKDKQTVRWLEQLESFMSEAEDGASIHLKRLSLDDAEQAMARALIMSGERFIGEVRKESIVVVKLSEAQYAAAKQKPGT